MRILLLVALFVAFLPARADIGEGSWETEVTTTMPGMPAGATTVRQTQCLRAEDGRDPAKLFGSPGAGCEFTDRRDDGSTYRFTISCTGAASVSGSGEMRYSRDTLDGEIVLRMSQGGQSVETRTSMRARRVGPCR